MMTTPFLSVVLNYSKYAAWSLKIECSLSVNCSLFIEDPPEELRGEKQWQDQKVQATIILSLKDDRLVHVRGMDTAKEYWDAQR